MQSIVKETPKPRLKIRLLYHKYLGIASKLGIHLQDPPPEISKQSNQVDECLARRGNTNIVTSYNAGVPGNLAPPGHIS